MAHSVNDLASSFVEMAKAYERLPEVERQFHEMAKLADERLDTIQRLELKLIERSNEIADLNSRIHALEVSRDDAELRFLECDDAKATLVRTLETIRSDINGVLQAVMPLPQEPPKAESMPLVDGPLSSPFVPGTDTSPPDASSSDAATGQSEPDPTSHPADVQSASSSWEAAHTTTEVSATTVAASEGKSEVPFPVTKAHITVPQEASAADTVTPAANVASPPKYIQDPITGFWELNEAWFRSSKA